MGVTIGEEVRAGEEKGREGEEEGGKGTQGQGWVVGRGH